MAADDDRERILDDIRRLALENGGVPLGERRFHEVTGLSRARWRGRYWRNWSDAVAAAGFTPNKPADAHDPAMLRDRLVQLTRKLQRFPTYADLRLAKTEDPTFPWHQAFKERLGDHVTRIELVRAYAKQHEAFADVLAYLSPEGARDADESAALGTDGSVYMLKLGKHYKIGKSFSVPRRHREIAIELPEKPDLVHVIATDDPSGIEGYWHQRFAAKRTNGEWFALAREDVKAFKRRRFM